MTNEVLFSRKIKCFNCGKNYKGKLERGKRVYICSNYDNFGKCKREILKQDFILEVLLIRYGENFEISKENIQKIIEEIIVEDSLTFKIKIKDDDPIIFGEVTIQF